MLCPKCKTDQASRSHRRGPLEHAIAFFGFYPYRCRNCKARFVSLRPDTAAPASANRPGVEREIKATRSAMAVKRKRREFLLYATAVVLFLAFLYYVTRERTASFEGSLTPPPAFRSTDPAC